GGVRYKIDAISGEIYAEESFNVVNGWETYDDAAFVALSLSEVHPAPADADPAVLNNKLSRFEGGLVDRKVTIWAILVWVIRSIFGSLRIVEFIAKFAWRCKFRLTYGAGNSSESMFPFPTLHPGDTTEFEIRSGFCGGSPFTKRSPPKSLAYQNYYYHAMTAARHALWDRPTSLYSWMPPRYEHRLHIKVYDSPPHYVRGTKTIWITDVSIHRLLTLHEYGHYVHHTYAPPNYYQGSCLVRAVDEGVADAIRTSLDWVARQATPSADDFLNRGFRTSTLGGVAPAISTEAECTANPYGDGRAIGEILWAFLNNRYCTFDSSEGENAACQVAHIIDESKWTSAYIGQWGREALTHAMKFCGRFSTAASPPSPYKFIDEMGYWFKVLSEVYNLISADEWERIRQVFLIHGLDIGIYYP
ncbi:MAG: hypothetical protein ACFFCO_12245, partial [Promethearchaeota archaeon]